MKYTLNERLGEVKMTEQAIMNMRQPKQLREITCYILRTHGVGKELDQKSLFKELDSHQNDNVVLSKTPEQYISRIFSFYRGRLDKIGLFKVDRPDRKKKAHRYQASEGSDLTT